MTAMQQVFLLQEAGTSQEKKQKPKVGDKAEVQVVQNKIFY